MPHLPEQLESIDSQTLPPTEVVVFDDRSSDETISILNRWASSAAFPVSVHSSEEQAGYNLNFERCLRATSGEIVVPADQDDRWLPDKLAVLSDELTREPAGALVFSNATIIDDEGSDLGTTLWSTVGLGVRELSRFSGGGTSQLCSRNTVTGATMAFRRELLDLAVPFPEQSLFTWDHWLALVAATATRIRPVPRILTAYRRHGAQTLGLPGEGPKRYDRSTFVAWRDASRFALDRVRELPDPSRVMVETLEQRLEHLDRRLSIRSSPFARVRDVGTEVATGRYQRFSNGWRSILRDLFIGDLAKQL